MKFLDELYKNDRIKICDQEQLSQMTGIGVNVIKNIESGRKKVSPSHEEFLKICEVLGLDANKYFAKNTKILTFLSNKGGSTKTSSCVGVSYSLATKYNKKCLIIDTDLQQNLSQNFYVIPDDDKNFYNAFITENDDIRNHIRPTAYNNIDIVTSHENMSIMEDAIVTVKFKEYKMRELLKGVKESGEYDYIIIDCNPSLGGVNISCLMATDGLIIPVVPSTFGKSGLDIMANTFNNIKDRAENLNLLGVLLNRVDARKKKPKEIIQSVKESFGKSAVIFDTTIPEDNNVDNSQREYEPVGYRFPKSRASIAYDELCEEVIKRADKI